MTRSIINTAGQNSDNIHIKELTSPASETILNMDVKQLPAVHEISYRYLSKVYRGIGIINQNKGIEFICQELMESPVTLKSTGISLLPARKEKRSSRLCAFFDVMDYFAYLSLQANSFIRLPSDSDVIIMSDVRNFLHLLIEGDDYSRVYLFFPNSVTGITITQTLKDRYGGNAVACNSLYKGYSSLLQYAKAIEIPIENKD